MRHVGASFGKYRNARTIAQVAIFWHSSAQALQASPQALHSVILGKLIAFFLAIVANHLDSFSKMAGMLGIDRRKRVQRGAGGNELKSSIGAGSHARVLHGEHAVAMPEAIIACHDTLRRGVRFEVRTYSTTTLRRAQGCQQAGPGLSMRSDHLNSVREPSMTLYFTEDFHQYLMRLR
jgi:hypothetical protein